MIERVYFSRSLCIDFDDNTHSAYKLFITEYFKLVDANPLDLLKDAKQFIFNNMLLCPTYCKVGHKDVFSVCVSYIYNCVGH